MNDELVHVYWTVFHYNRLVPIDMLYWYSAVNRNVLIDG